MAMFMRRSSGDNSGPTVPVAAAVNLAPRGSICGGGDDSASSFGVVNGNNGSNGGLNESQSKLDAQRARLAESLLEESDATERQAARMMRRRSSMGGGAAARSRRGSLSLVTTTNCASAGGAGRVGRRRNSEEERQNFESLQRAIKDMDVTTNAGIRELFARHIDEGDYIPHCDDDRNVELKDMSSSSRRQRAFDKKSDAGSSSSTLTAAFSAEDYSYEQRPRRPEGGVAEFKRAVRRLSSVGAGPGPSSSSPGNSAPPTPTRQQQRRRGSIQLMAETFRLDREVIQA